MPSSKFAQRTSYRALASSTVTALAEDRFDLMLMAAFGAKPPVTYAYWAVCFRGSLRRVATGLRSFCRLAAFILWLWRFATSWKRQAWRAGRRSRAARASI